MIKKFRAWDKYLKKFIQSEYFAIGLDGTLIQRNICYSNDPDDTWDESWNEELDDDKYIIEQFTGLLDKNGREIYESDIVCSTQDHEAYLMSSIFSASEWTNYSSGIIKWIIDGWHVCEKDIGATRLGVYSTCDCHGAALIVIGNVHENNT